MCLCDTCVVSDLLPELEAKLASDLSASASPEQNKDAINKILTQFQAASGAPDDSKSVILKNQDTIRYESIVCLV